MLWLLTAAPVFVAGHVTAAGDRGACTCWSTTYCSRSPPAAHSALASCSRRRSPACRSAAALCRSPLDAAGGWVAGHVSFAGDRRACRCWSTRHCGRSPPAVRSVLASCSHRRSSACRKAAARCRSPLDAARWMAGGHVTVAGDRCTCRCWSTRCCGRSLPRCARRWQGAGAGKIQLCR